MDRSRQFFYPSIHNYCHESRIIVRVVSNFNGKVFSVAVYSAATSNEHSDRKSVNILPVFTEYSLPTTFTNFEDYFPEYDAMATSHDFSVLHNGIQRTRRTSVAKVAIHPSRFISLQFLHTYPLNIFIISRARLLGCFVKNPPPIPL